MNEASGTQLRRIDNYLSTLPPVCFGCYVLRMNPVISWSAPLGSMAQVAAMLAVGQVAEIVTPGFRFAVSYGVGQRSVNSIGLDHRWGDLEGTAQPLLGGDIT